MDLHSFALLCRRNDMAAELDRISSDAEGNLSTGACGRRHSCCFDAKRAPSFYLSPPPPPFFFCCL